MKRYFIRLAVPTRRAVNRILEVARDPRWNEVIRLAAGYIDVYQGDEEALKELVEALLDETQDSLEPFVCTRLRLLAACAADGVGFRQRDINRVIECLTDRLLSLPRPWPVIDHLREALDILPRAQPEGLTQTTIDALCRLSKHKRWDVRMEAARRLADVAERSDTARQTLKILVQDNDANTQACAAVGLWQAGHALKPLVSHIAYGPHIRSDIMTRKPTSNLLIEWLSLLKDEDADVRWHSVRGLGQWGPQTEAVPILIELLKDENVDVRRLSVWGLGQWGPQTEAVPILIELLKDEDADVRGRSAQVLGQWGLQTEAIPILIELLKDENVDVRRRSAQHLSQWGLQTEAVPILIELLKDKDTVVQGYSAQVLGQWGLQTEVVPILIESLKDEDAFVRGYSAEVLGQWGLQTEAVPILIELLK